MLHLREVEIGANSRRDEVLGVVEEVEREIEDGTTHGLIVDGNTGFIEMPATRTTNANCLKKTEAICHKTENSPNNEHCGLLDELVLFSALFKVDVAANSIPQVDLAVEQVLESGRIRI